MLRLERIGLVAALAGYMVPMGYALYTMNYTLASIWTLAPLGFGLTWFAFKHFEKFLILMTALVPLSVSVKDLGNGYGMSFPGEMLLGLSALILGFNLLRNPRLDRRILLHPLSLLMLLQGLWLLTTTLTSVYTEVSLKMLLSRLAYWLVFYLGMLLLFRDFKKIKSFIWAYVAGLLPVMIYSVWKLSTMGLSRSFSPEMAEPFFDDHTVLGACIAMLLPSVWFFWRSKEKLALDLRWKNLLPFALVLMVVTLFLSFSRAAWLSVLVAVAFYGLMRLRVSFWTILLVLMIGSGAAYLYQEQIYERFSANENASGEDVMATAKSITNVSTDESNKERLNRWSCAVEMYKERPWTGFGPGTYERSYGVFQVYHQKTRISTNDGDRGDAHSEYLTALSEQGLPGFIIHLALLAGILATGMKVAYRSAKRESALVATGITLGFITYFLHGGVNSFLDLDKAAALVWGLAAVLVALDIYHSRAEELGGRPMQDG